MNQISLPDFYNDISDIQIAFTGNDEGLYIKYPNNFDNYDSLIFYNFQNQSAKKLSVRLTKNKFTEDKQYRGIIAYELHDNYTNRMLFQETNVILIKDHFTAELKTSDDSQILFQVKNKQLCLYNNSFNNLTHLDLPIINQSAFFPNSENLLFAGFIKDSNQDGVIDWKDDNSLYLYDTVLNTIKTNLLKDIDSFLGITSTGQYLFYRKGNAVFSIEIKNK